MRRTVPVVLTLSLLSGCIGSFALTNKLYDFNREVSDSIVVQEVVFLAFLIIPIYEVSLFIDAVVLNTIEAITGDNPVASRALESRVAELPDGTSVAAIQAADGSVTIELDREGRKLQRRVRRLANRLELHGDGVASITLEGDGSAVLVDARGRETVIDADTLQRAARAHALGGNEALVAEVAAALRPPAAR